MGEFELDRSFSERDDSLRPWQAEILPEWAIDVDFRLLASLDERLG